MRLGPFQLAAGVLRLGQDAFEVRSARSAPPPRDASFEVAGDRVPAWIYGGGERTPAVLLLHTAFGLTAHERAFAVRLAREGLACMVVRYSARTTGAVLLDHQRRGILEAIVEAALRRLQAEAGVDPGRIAVLGFSLGGYLALHLATRNETPLRAAVAYYGVYPYSQHQLAALRVPLLLVQGERDRAIFVGPARAAERIAREHGHDCELALYPGAVHQFDLFQPRSAAARDAWERTRTFLRRHLFTA